MDGYEEKREALNDLGVSIFAGSVDDEDRTTEVAEKLGFPVACNMTRAMGEQFGAWWDEDRQFIQPSEFFISGDGKVLASTYSSSPIGRMEPEDGLMLAEFLIKKSP